MRETGHLYLSNLEKFADPSLYTGQIFGGGGIPFGQDC